MLSTVFKRVLAVLPALALTLTILSVNAAAAETSLTIIHINDRHGRMDADPYISQLAKETQGNVLILDAGDALHGQTTTNLSKGAAMVELMNDVGYSAMAVGNHEFNFGVERLQELSEMMNFPLLAANVVTTDDTRLFKPYEVFDFDGFKVGVFGLATPETPSKSDPRNMEGLVFLDPVETAEVAVTRLKTLGCDIIIALVHLGVDKETLPEWRSEALLEISDIDVIIDGHSHTVMDTVTTGTPIFQTGSLAANIGVIELTLSGGFIQYALYPVSGELAADENIAAKIEALDEESDKITSVAVGNTPALLQGERAFVRTQETNLANLITDSMRFATGAEISFLTGGNIRASIEAGDITMKQVLTTLPFSNLLVTVELSGKDLLLAFEHGVSQYPEAAGAHIQVSGINFQFDPTAEPGSRVTNVVMENGAAFDVNKTYTVATSEFLAVGGDGYDMLANGKNLVYYGGDADALANYIATKPAITEEPQGRISAIEALVTIEAPAPAIEALATVPEAAVYIVLPGDYLTKIANMYNTTWRELQRINGIKNPDLIYPGQEIKLQ